MGCWVSNWQQGQEGALGVAIASRAEGTPSPDGGDSVILSPPQPLLVASQTFQQEMSSSSRLSQGQWVWAPLSPASFGAQRRA